MDCITVCVNIIITGPPTLSVGAKGARLVTLAGICRRVLSSSVTLAYNITYQGAALGRPVVLRPIRATPCLLYGVSLWCVNYLVMCKLQLEENVDRCIRNKVSLFRQVTDVSRISSDLSVATNLVLTFHIFATRVIKLSCPFLDECRNSYSVGISSCTSSSRTAFTDFCLHRFF